MRKAKGYGKRWYTPAKRHANHVKRQARIDRAKARGRHTKYEWLLLIIACDCRCVGCGKQKPLTKDHIVPIYWDLEEASDAIDNIQPLCKSCNSKNGESCNDRRPDDWYGRMEIADEFLKNSFIGFYFAASRWATMTPAQRSAEMKRRAKKRKNKTQKKETLS